ncbi:D-arabinose 1-dehydrogenase [Aureococcus anophagefferens]|nr:D-arabinose 1-dehydrogenase [Aureococcus anophagefferens]
MRLSTSLIVVGAVVRGFAPVGVARPAVGRLGASKDEEAIGKQAKGFYIRPSAAIERGGGFFVPGLEGTKLRVALGGGLVGLVALSVALGGDAAPSVRASEAIAFVAAVGILAPTSRGPRPATRARRRTGPPSPPALPERGGGRRRRAGDAPWAAAAVRAAIPEATFVALLDARTGAVLLLDGAPATSAPASPVPAGASRREAGKLFAALGGDADASKAAFVVPALDATRTWIIGAGDADLLRDDDRAWVSRLFRASS